MQDQEDNNVYKGKIESTTRMAGEADMAGLVKGKWTAAGADMRSPYGRGLFRRRRREGENTSHDPRQMPGVRVPW